MPQRPNSRDATSFHGFTAWDSSVLAAAILYLWQYPSTPGEPPPEATAIQAIQQQLANIDARLTRLEQRPTVDLGKITARLDALDGRVVDQTQLASRVDTLSGRIKSLSARDQTGLDAIKQRLDGVTSQIMAVIRTPATSMLSPNAWTASAGFKKYPSP